MDRRAALGVMAFLAFSSAASAGEQARNAYVGTWRLDVSASTASGTRPLAAMLQIAEVGDGRLRVHVQELFAGGREAIWSFSFGKVGKRTPIRGLPDIDTALTTAAARRASRCLFKKGDKVITEVATELDAGGEILTITRRTPQPTGDYIVATSVYRRPPT